MKSKILSFLVIFLVIFSANTAFSYVDSANDSPFDVVYNHTHFLNKNSYNELKASESFNIPNKKKRIKVAIDLYDIIYGKGIDLNIIVNKISDNPNHTDSSTNRSIYYISDKLPQVYLEKVGDKWYYSQATIDAIPQLHKQVFPFGSNIWTTWFPVKNKDKFLKLFIWQWLGLSIIITIFFVSFFLLRFILKFIFYKFLFKKYVNEIKDLDKIKLISNLFSFWVATKFLQVLIPTLFINAKYALPIIRGIAFVTAFIMVLIVYRFVELIIFYLKQYTDKTATKWDDQFLVIAQKFLKALIIFLGLFFVLNTLDINVATIIAGLSVGGLALALAAQDTVKNFIASVMIYLDKPFRIGDNIKGDGFEGVVQEVGFRSSRIKTATESIVYISNAKFAEMTIDNKGAKSLRRFNTELIVPFEIPLYKVERFLEAIRTILMKYTLVKSETIDVYITNVQDAGITIMVNYKYSIYNVREELKHREFILVNILKVAGILKINLFEKNQTLVQPNNDIVENLSSEDLDIQLNDFFVGYEAHVSKIK